MKKLLVFALAAIGMVACVKEEVTLLPQGDAISFESAFIDNATRAEDPSITTATLGGFNVWGFVKEHDGEIFNGVEVTKNGNVWSYDGTQYWVPNQPYYFAALAPMDSANWAVTKATGEAAKLGLGTIKFTNNNGTEDLLYAKETMTSKGLNEPNGAVKFQFQHLLSKVKFTFKNGFPTETASIKVTNVKMTAPAEAEINLAQADYTKAWDLADTTPTTLSFGDVEKLAYTQSAEVACERLTIPASVDESYTITFDVELFMGEQSVYTVDKTSVVTGVELAMGQAYNFSAEINPANLELEEIVFEVERVDGWVPEGGQQVDVDYFYDEASKTYIVASASGLADFAEDLNDGTVDMTSNVVLGGDIDLNDLQSRAITSNWTPIGSAENPFTGTFDGKGYTIKNLALVEQEAKEGKAYIGFFGYAKDATIKNVTFENVYIDIPCLDIDHSQGHIGAVAGSLEGTSTIENVTVKGDVTIYTTQDANGASRVAVVAGGNSYGNVTMKNVHVIANEGSSLIANNNVGALAGQLQGKMLFESCSSNINVTANKFFAGGLVGIAAGDSYIKNCHTTGNVSVVAGRENRHNDEYRVGGIAGGWADGKTKVFTLEGCTYTGTLYGANSDGTVVENFDYAGYVGRGYTLSNCAGSKVIIDGVEYVQKYDNVYGVYTINGCTPVSTAEELVATLAAGEGVYLMNDITIAASKGGYDKAGILQNKAQTIDGGGHTLTVTGAVRDWNCGIYTNGGIIRNLTVKGAWRGIFTAGQSSDLHIENVEFKNVVYTFNSDGKMPANPFGVYVSNSIINGWTSHSNMHTEVVYTNCSFGEGSGYKKCRPYGKTSFVNCTFCPGYTVDKSQTTELTFTDCIWE